jgi:hypothetical protein
MPRTVAKLASLAALFVAGLLVLAAYRDQTGARATRVAAEQRSEQLEQVVQRLSTDRRVADVIVTEQAGSASALKTTLLFVEYGPDGSALPAKRFTIDGDVAHVAAMAIQFDGKFVEQNEPLHGHSVALFTRLYGEHQPPEMGFRIDEPGGIPAVYRGPNPQVPDLERELWANFWKLADDEAYRKEMGVRVAQGEAVWTKLQPDRLYTLTLESNGALYITASPLKGIYREALRGAVSNAQ